MVGVYVLIFDMMFIYEMKEVFLKCWDMMIEELSKILGMKVNKLQGVFYIFLDISVYFGKKVGDFVINDVDDFCEYFLKEVYVVVVIGFVFGVFECFCIFYVVSEVELWEVVKCIVVVVECLG